jgi:two-component system probable response regulator PhcQ
MNRILLVDDEQNVLNALRRELKDDYEIEAFSNPVDALLRSKEAAFDLVIADYQMPDMDGIQFLKQFGDIQPDAARLILSGQADIDALISAINETHIYRFIAKPWDNLELQSCIAQALDFRNVVLENRRQAFFYRLAQASPEPHEIQKIYRVILVDSDTVSLTVMRRGLTQETDYEGLRVAMRQEITHGKADKSHGIEFVVDAFTTAQAALNHARHYDCELIVTAQALPDMDGTQLLGEIQKIRPDAARILISSNPDKPLLSQAINEAQVHSFLCLYWDTADYRSNIARQALNVHQLKTAIMQALTSRDLLLEERRQAKLHGQN